VAEPPAPRVVRPKPVWPETVVWAFPEELSDDAYVAPLCSAPAVDQGGRIFLHVRRRLVALEQRGGGPSIAWEYVTGSNAPGPVIVAPDGSLRLHCADGYLHGVTPDGRQMWPPANVGQPLGRAAPIADLQGVTWISAYEGGLIRVNDDGRVQKPGPFFRSRQKFDSAGLIHDRMLFVGSDEGYVFAIRLDGDRGANAWDSAAGQGHAGWYIHSALAMAEEGILVVASRDEHLYGFSLDGRCMWRTAMPGQMLGSPVLDRSGNIYVGITQMPRGQEARGSLMCLDGNSHKIRWEYKASGPVESTPVIGDDDVIYFGDNAGIIHAVDFRGSAVWTAPVGSPVRSAGTILGPERVAFGLESETLVVLKCSSKGLASGGWPKFGRTLGQCGVSAPRDG